MVWIEDVSELCRVHMITVKVEENQSRAQILLLFTLLFFRMAEIRTNKLVIVGDGAVGKTERI